MLDNLKEEAKKVLSKGQVKYLIGYRRGEKGFHATPAFFEKAEDIDKLNFTFDPTCVHNLVRFLSENKEKRPVAIVVKGCDSRAINVLLQEKFIERTDVHVIGVSCGLHGGVVDEHKALSKVDEKQIERVQFAKKEGNFEIITSLGKKIDVPSKEILMDRCLECQTPYPVIHDSLVGKVIKEKRGNQFKSLNEFSELDDKGRWNYFSEQFDKCIRCYACRSVCPMCYCGECVTDSINFAVNPQTTAKEKADKIKWIDRSATLSESGFFHLSRAMHLAGRCVDCGECARVCPMDIPIRLLNKKLEKDALELYEYTSGMDTDSTSLVSSFKEKDPEEFIR